MPDSPVVERSPQVGSRLAVAVAVTLAAVYLPHLFLYATSMVAREHYQFLPLAWLGAVVLVWVRRADLRSGSPPTRAAWGWLGVGLGTALLVAAGVLPSSWLAMASVPLLLPGLAWLGGGPTTVRALIPALILFLTTLRPPGTVDLTLIRELRTLAVWGAGYLLDGLGIVFVPLSNVLRVPGGDLLVDEACSGVNSLVSIMAVVLFLGLLLRRGPIHLGLLLIWAAVVVILANVGRVTVVTVAFTRYRIDLIHGWRHEALGVALYAVSLGLVASMEQLFFLFEPLFGRSPGRSSARDAAATAPRPGGIGARLGLTQRRAVILTAVLGTAALILPARWVQGLRSPEANTTEVARLVAHNRATLAEPNLPVELAGWRRVGYKTEERQRDDVFGQFSSVWEYRRGNRTALICVDYPFVGWHELLTCYGGINWTARERSVIRGEVRNDPNQAAHPVIPSVAATLSSGTGEHATLRYALIDEADHWAEPPADRGWGQAGWELPWAVTARRALSQVQLFSSGYRIASPADQDEQDQLFQAACREFQQRIFAAGRSEP